MGLADGLPLIVVFTDRVGPAGAIVRRIINSRLSNRRERRRYAETLEASRTFDETDEGPR